MGDRTDRKSFESGAVTAGLPEQSIMRHLSAIARWMWRHLSLLLILASWVYAALRRWTPQNIAGWSLTRFFTHALIGTLVTWLLIWLLLKHDGENVSDLGLHNQQLKRVLFPGILFGIVIFVITNILLPQFTRRLFADSETAIQTTTWFQGWGKIPAWIFLGWFAGGLTEEVTRAFELTRFERTFGRVGLMISLGLSSVIFGIGHLYQGQRAAFDIGITGALYALVYLRRRSCWEAAVAHATFDTIGITILFWMNLEHKV